MLDGLYNNFKELLYQSHFFVLHGVRSVDVDDGVEYIRNGPSAIGDVPERDGVKRRLG
jgi:hypothetical protein